VVGAFTLLGIVLGLGFFVWLAKVQIDRVYTQYDIIFDSAAGLGQSSAVRFNGIDVGKVLTIALDKTDPSKVRVRIEVSAATPVRQGTEATLASQGVTGVAFVGLVGGDVGAKRLPVNAATGIAEIPSKPTVVQGLLADAPDLLANATSALDDVRRFSTPENAAHIASILANLDEASGRLNAVVDDLTKAAASLSKAADNVSGFSDKLDTLADNANGALDDARKTLADVDDFATNGLPQFTSVADHGNKVLTQISGFVAKITKDPAGFLLNSKK
jgi:phospholipid/cholesterol/gamma-HCH transport system substrate-binding protein